MSISDESNNLLNLGAMSTVVFDVEATLTVLALVTAVILNIVKTIGHIREQRENVNK
jgi:hypothetical protein